jgi:hypothetical protein
MILDIEAEVGRGDSKRRNLAMGNSLRLAVEEKRCLVGPLDW